MHPKVPPSAFLQRMVRGVSQRQQGSIDPEFAARSSLVNQKIASHNAPTEKPVPQQNAMDSSASNLVVDT
jgi:hypothetical protein